MKLRIHGNTLRLRLTQSEVGLVSEGRQVEESTLFPGGAELKYVLRLSQSETKVVKTTKGEVSSIDVVVESDKAMEWAKSDEVGLYGEEPLTLGSLELLIEKDFACLNPREGAEDLDSFPNPALTLGN